jgi:hypothetical protein
MSRYDLFRRRIAPIAFFLAIGWIAWDACDSGERTRTTVELQLGAAAPEVRAVEVEVWLGTELHTRYHRAALPGMAIGPCRFELSLPRNDGELRIDVDLGATRRQITRRFHAVEGSTMYVALADELGRRAR